MELTLECQPRPKASANALRYSGQMPAVLYGHKGTESIPLVVDGKAAELLVRDASVNNTLIQLSIPGLAWKGKVLLREVHRHPWRKQPYHLSFFAIADHGDLEVDIPLNIVGTPVGVKLGGGSQEVVLTSLQVRCASDRIPESIDVDVSNLDVGGSLHVKDLNLPSGVAAVGDPERVIVIVQGGRGGDEVTED
jgi:large subunit ribosomal protein L25